MIRQSFKNSFNNSFITSFKHTNQPIHHQYSTHTQKHNPNYNCKKRSQSFMSQNNKHDKLIKQLQAHKKHNSSFNNKIFNTKNNQQLTSQTKKQQKSDHTRKSSSSTTKHKKQRTISFIIPQQQKHKVKGGIRKNNCEQNISYQSNKDNHLHSINSNLQPSKISKKQNKSISIRGNVQRQNNDNDDSLKRQDNIKTDYEQRPHHIIQFKKKITSQKYEQQQQTQFINDQNIQEQHAILHKENINPNININLNEIQKLDQVTSKRISQLQSRSQTIDLLKFTIKTKLSKDFMNDSQHCLNSLMSSDNKSSQKQYIQQILKLKDLQANFYIDKITSLQNQLNKTRKQRKFIEQEIYIKCNQDNRKNIIEKIRYQEENQLLKRQNEALRSIIMKKINKGG